MLKDARYRVILIVVIAITLIIGIFVYFNMQGKKEAGGFEAEFAGAPKVRSIPGERKASEAYRSAVEAENIAQAERAAKEGGSAVPTIVQPTYQDAGRFPGQPGAQTPPGCTPDELKKARAAGVRAEELRCKGCSAEQLKASGYTAGELKAAGFTAEQLKNAGYTVEQLKNAGFSVDDLEKAGFPVQQFKNEAAFLKNPAFPKDCSAESLKKALAANIPADLIKKKLNCSAQSLKSAGYPADQLKRAGFSAKDLKDAGFSAKDLKDAGFTAGELKDAGFLAKELKGLGFTPSELRDAGFTAGELKTAGFTPDELKKVGYSRGDLLRAGFTPEDLKEVATSPLSENFPKDCSPESLRKAYAANVPVSEIRRALGCRESSLRAAGYSPEMLSGNAVPQRQPGFPKDCSPESLSRAKAYNISAEKIKEMLNCDAKALKAAGYKADELKGYTAGQLKAAGFSNGDLVRAGYTPQEIREAAQLLREEGGFSPELGEGLPSVSPDRQAQFLSELRKRQTEQLSDQERQAAMQQMMQLMQTQASDMLASWAPPPTQSFVLIKEPVPPAALVGKGEGGSALPGGGMGGFGGSQPQKGTIIKAGTVMFGVLDTGINSDEDSPILASVIQGELKGAKLLGSFSRKDKRVLVSFRTIDLPTVRNSISINAVAIDPEIARTALASRVDNHYLLRYGTLFASSFISGLANAIMQSGSTTSANAATGLVVQSTPKLNSGQKALIALGNVGQQYASVLAQNFTVAPTVHVDAGVGIGILLMQDLLIPEDNAQLDTLLAKEEEKAKEEKREARVDTLERLEMERRGYYPYPQGQQQNVQPQPVIPQQIIPQQPLQLGLQPQQMVQPQLGQMRQP